MINTVELYREFSDPWNRECCERGFPLETQGHPYGSTIAYETFFSDVPCTCKFGKIRAKMEQVMGSFELDDDAIWDDPKQEQKLFHVALLVMDLEGET